MLRPPYLPNGAPSHAADNDGPISLEIGGKTAGGQSFPVNIASALGPLACPLQHSVIPMTNAARRVFKRRLDPLPIGTLVTCERAKLYPLTLPGGPGGACGVYALGQCWVP